MRHLIASLSLMLLLLLALSCRTHKAAATASALRTDSVSHAISHERTLLLDSLFSSTSFSFDSLEIVTTLPAPADTAPSARSVRIKVAGGHIDNTTRKGSTLATHREQEDSTATTRSEQQAEQSESSTVAVYDPPSPLKVALTLGACALIVLFLIYRINRWK